MNTKEIVVYSGNLVLTLAILGLFYVGKLSWEVAAGMVGVMLMPSAAHVAIQRLQTPAGKL